MKVLVIADGHYFKDDLGHYYCDAVFDYNFFSRYLSIFDEVFALVRCETCKEVDSKWKKCDGKGVKFIEVSNTRGPWDYFKKIFRLRREIRQAIRMFDCAILRVPSVLGNTVYSLWPNNKKLALEVVVDPWEYFKKGTIKGFIRPFVRIHWTKLLKKMCLRANGVSYVTQNYLQNKYPCRALRNEPRYFTASYSSVELPDDSFSKPKMYYRGKALIISHVAVSFATYGKGHIELMKAVKIVIDKGYDVKVRFVGDGPLKERFINFAIENGIQDHIEFIGLLPSGFAVREELRKSDIFVFPTKAEGLPRCVLEAMSQGLPVISSPVCGIPEILDNECLCDYSDINSLANKIIKMINDPKYMEYLSKTNLEISSEFKSSLLNKRRQYFYGQLRDAVCEEK